MNHLPRVRLRHTLTAAVGAAAATGLILAAPVATHAAERGGGRPAALTGHLQPAALRLPDSATLDGPELARGWVVTASGAPASGAGVVLYAWPSNDLADRLVAGDHVDLTAVAWSRAATDGSYALRVPDLAGLVPFTGRDHALNLEVVASFPDGTTGVHAFARDLVAGRLSRASASGDRELRLLPAGARTDASAGAAGPERADLDLDLGPERGPERGRSAPLSADAVTALSCGASLVKAYKPRWGLVGQHYSRTGGVRATFVYTTGAESQLGVGVSASGKFGTFHAQGSSSKSSSGSVTYKPVRGATSAYRLTTFTYGKYHVTCFGPFGTVTTHYEMRATRWAGGSRTRYPQPIRARHCVPFEAGSTFAKKDTRAIRWTNGMDVSGAIGIDLSVRTGYSQEALVRFHFVHGHRLCGSGDYPGGRPFQLEARR